MPPSAANAMAVCCVCGGGDRSVDSTGCSEFIISEASPCFDATNADMSTCAEQNYDVLATKCSASQIKQWTTRHPVTTEGSSGKIDDGNDSLLIPISVSLSMVIVVIGAIAIAAVAYKKHQAQAAHKPAVKEQAPPVVTINPASSDPSEVQEPPSASPPER